VIRGSRCVPLSPESRTRGLGIVSQHTSHVDTYARDHLPPREQWPEFVHDLPELQYPARINCATRLVDDAIAEGHGARIALRSDSGTVTYAELLERSNRLANHLVSELGIVPGNRVLLRAPNSPAMVVAWLAVVKCGAIAVPTMPLLRAKELSVIAERAQVRHALCDPRLVGELEQAAQASGLLDRIVRLDAALDERLSRQPATFTNCDTAQDDVCLLAFTSGTTGKPKGTMHFHRDVLAMADIVARHLLRTSPDDVYVGSPPIAFTFGLGAQIVFPLSFRASVTLVEQPSATSLLEAIQRHRATCLFTAPTMYGHMRALVGSYDISSLRQCVSAGEPLSKATSDAWFEATGIRIIDGIGSTEMLHIFIGAVGDEIRPGATGKPLPGYQACVLDEQYRPLPRGQAGWLAVKGPTGCRYLDDPRQREYVVQGWNVTGDRYYVDEDGYFWFQARADDMIVSAGYNIAGPEVEAVLLAHAAVRECAVVASPDPVRGHVVKAYIVVSETHTATPALVRELQDFVKASIAPYKYPRAVEFVDALPKTQTGKVQRFVLRERERQAAAARDGSTSDKPG
jgi:2-aminobenzoate-CoA ligase